MTAPDPGLTDLIAAHYRTITTAVIYRDDESDGAHRKGFECVCACGDEYMASTRAGDRTEATVLRRADSAHVALVVEQHTNGRIAELEAELAEAKDDKFYAQVELNADVQWKARANRAEAAIARVIEGAQMLVESFQRVERGGNHLYDASTHRCADNLALLLAEAQGPEHLRAALEGEQR